MCLHCILEGGENLVYFTRTPRKRGKRGGGKGLPEEVVVEKEDDESQTPFRDLSQFG